MSARGELADCTSQASVTGVTSRLGTYGASSTTPIQVILLARGGAPCLPARRIQKEFVSRCVGARSFVILYVCHCIPLWIVSQIHSAIKVEQE